MKNDFKLIPAAFTPFDKNGEVNLAAIPAYAALLEKSCK